MTLNRYTFAGLNFSSANFTQRKLKFFCGLTIDFSHKNTSAEHIPQKQKTKWWEKEKAQGAHKNVLKLHSG